MHLDSLFFLVLVAVAAFLRWAVQRAQSSKSAADESKPARAPRPTPPVFRETETDEDRIRRFMEALGQPPGAAPPQKIKPRQEFAPRRSALPIPPIDPFPRPRIVPLSRPPDLETAEVPEVGTPQPIRAAQQDEGALPRKVFVPTPSPAVFKVETEEGERTQSTTPNSPHMGGQPSGVAQERAFVSFLHSQGGLRQAVLLREIFGRPRSLQPLDPLAAN